MTTGKIEWQHGTDVRAMRILCDCGAEYWASVPISPIIVICPSCRGRYWCDALVFDLLSSLQGIYPNIPEILLEKVPI